MHVHVLCLYVVCVSVPQCVLVLCVCLCSVCTHVGAHVSCVYEVCMCNYYLPFRLFSPLSPERPKDVFHTTLSSIRCSVHLVPRRASLRTSPSWCRVLWMGTMSPYLRMDRYVGLQLGGLGTCCVPIMGLYF